MSNDNSCIYKLYCKDKNITDCYVGSTTNFKHRKRNHKKACNNENDRQHHFKVYQFIRDNGGWNNWSIEIIEEVNVNDKKELRKLERKYIESLNSTLNCVIPTRSIKEWCEDNKEYYKEYYENNKEEIKEYIKEYRENNKEKISENKKEYYVDNKVHLVEKAKEYYVDNKERIKEYSKEYYQNNKEKRKAKIECEFCKSFVSKSNIAKHRKTNKCIEARKNKI